MKIKVRSRRAGKAKELKIKRIGIRSLAIALVGLSISCVGIKNIANVQCDTSATSDNVEKIGSNLVINPAYEEYMADVAAGKEDDWELIPNKYIQNNDSRLFRSYRASNTNLPATYNLIDEGYGTLIKNQGSDGICWAFSITTAVESYLLKNEIADIEFSPKQMDYLYANDAINGYSVQNFGAEPHDLGSGYNFLLASLGFPTGLAPVEEEDFFPILQANDTSLADHSSWLDYENKNTIIAFLTGEYGDAYTKELPYNKIVEPNNNYIITEFTDYQFNSSLDIDLIKQSIYENGAAYVGTVSPGIGSCWDEDSKTIIDKGSTVCGASNGHAMSVIGWDDNHSYTDPSDGSTKTGAFIIQNSWGESSLLSDYGITYDWLVSNGVIDPSTLTSEQIQGLKDAIANYDAHEIVYLAYEGASSRLSMTDFGLIDKVSQNDYDAIYSVTMGEDYKGVSKGEADNELVFTYTTDGETEYIHDISVANHLPLTVDLDYDIAVDNGNGFQYVGSITSTKDAFSQKMLALNSPIEVSGAFRIKITLLQNGTAIGGLDDYINYFSTAAYAKSNSGSSTNPTTNPSTDQTGGDPATDPTTDPSTEQIGGSTEDDIPVPSTGDNTSGSDTKKATSPYTGMVTEEDNGALAILSVSLPIIFALSFIGYNARRNKKHINFDIK